MISMIPPRLTLGAILTAAVLGMGRAASAQPRLVTRAAVVEGVQRNNAELRAARERLGIAEAEIVKASQLLPSNPIIQGEYGSDALLHNEGERRMGLLLSQELEIGFQRGPRRQRKVLARDEARARIRDLEARIARNAEDAYYALWRADRLWQLAKSAVALGRTLASASESRFSAGDISELDRNLVEIEIARSQAAEGMAAAEAMRARAEVNRMMGEPADTVLEAADDAVPPLPVIDPELLSRQAADRRADLAAVRLAEQVASAELTLRQREIIPNPTLSFGYSREEIAFSGVVGMGDLPSRHNASLLVGRLSLPIPVWDRKRAEVRAAQAVRGAVQIEREALERAVDSEVKTALKVAEAARRTLDAYASALPRVERNLDLLDKAFRGGEVALSDLLAARDRVMSASREHIEARATYARAIDELMRATAATRTNGGQ
jgi:cobalt-zinc-cadmium efflux system outer membrane protein